MPVDQSNSGTPLYSVVSNGRVAVSDYQQPIDCLPGKLQSRKTRTPTNDGYTALIQDNPGYSATNFA